jgi:hypothetical protein
VETHFAQHGNGTIKEVKLMNGFGFIEYEDEMDARDVVPGMFTLPHFDEVLANFPPAFRMFLFLPQNGISPYNSTIF